MTSFVLLNWGLCLLTAVILSVVIWQRRYLLVKPSVLTVVWFHLMIQWAAAAESPYIETYLPEPYVFVLLAHGFPLITFLLSMNFGTKQAETIFSRIITTKHYSKRVIRQTLIFSAVLLAIFVSYYIAGIGATKTGLYTLFYDPAISDITREESLKLIDDPLVQYGFALMAEVIAPMAAVALVVLLLASFKERKFHQSLFIVLYFFVLLVIVSMTGARGYAGALMLTALFAVFLMYGMPIKPVRIILTALLVLILPALFTLLREGQEVTWNNIYYYLTTSMFWRTFVGPMEVGLYYTHFAQTHYFFGVSAVPKLAQLMSVEPVNAPNLISRIYVSESFLSGSANGSFVFTYYSYFGLWIFPLCCAATLALDLALRVYKRLSNEFLLICIASVSASTSNLASTDFTTILITHGFLPFLLLATFADRFFKYRKATSRYPLAVRHLNNGAGIIGRSSKT